MTMAIEAVFGIPGSGKTTYLLNNIDRFVAEGYAISDIAFLTMTTNARKVARKRMEEKFGATKDELRHFRTFHSIGYEMIGRPSMVTPNHKEEYCKKIGVPYTPPAAKSAGGDWDLVDTSITDAGTLYFSAYDRIRLMHSKEISSLPLDLFKLEWFVFCSRTNLDDKLLRYTKDFEGALVFMRGWEEEKTRLGVVDYTDQLMKAYNSGLVLPTKILIVDEFQDLAPLMYNLYNTWKQNKTEVIVAGDDDQTIYSFAGADPKFLLSERGTADKITILDKSHRCSKMILTEANRGISRNTNRQPKDMVSLKDGGEVLDVVVRGGDDFIRLLRPGVDTLILARTNYEVELIRKWMIEARAPFHEIDHEGVWSSKFINILNAVMHLLHNMPSNGANAILSLSEEEFNSLVSALPAGYFRRGVKTKVKERVVVDRVSSLGLNFFKLNNRLAFSSALKITKKQREILEGWYISNKAEGGRVPTPIINRVGTIHKSKGDEATDVVLFVSLPNAIIKQLCNNSIREEERRVRYVGETRAKERLVRVKRLNGANITRF